LIHFYKRFYKLDQIKGRVKEEIFITLDIGIQEH